MNQSMEMVSGDVATSDVPQAPAVSKSAAKAEQYRAQIEAERKKIQAYKEKLLELQRQEDALSAREAMLSFLGGKVAIAVEFPEACANGLIPFKEISIHAVYSDDDCIYYSNARPRYMLSEGGLMCSMERNVQSVLSTTARVDTVQLAIDIVNRNGQATSGIRTVAMPYGPWEIRGVDGMSTYARPDKVRTWVTIDQVGDFLCKRVDADGNVYLMFVDSVYDNPEFQRVFDVGGIRIVLR